MMRKVAIGMVLFSSVCSSHFSHFRHPHVQSHATRNELKASRETTFRLATMRDIDRLSV